MKRRYFIQFPKKNLCFNRPDIDIDAMHFEIFFFFRLVKNGDR